MKTFFRVFLLISLVCFGAPTAIQAAGLAETLVGRILLQVESHGEAWYVDPVTQQRFFLGRAEDAYALMRAKGLGVRHAELLRYRASRFPARLSGRIVLDVEAHGEAYYIIPRSLTGVYLGRAQDAYALMRRYGLGITNTNLARIPVATGQINLPTPIQVEAPYQTLEQAAFNGVNRYRAQKNLAALNWNEEVATVARQHSLAMANGSVAFGHDGFSERAETLQQKLTLHGLAENVAYNDYPDPATTAVEGWINSTGHRLNIENNAYTLTGMGVARSSDGAYYFTQLFVAP